MSSSESSETPSRPPKPKATIAAVLLIIASLALPMYFWRGTWFGSGLSAEKMAAYLAADARPRHTQHALVQFADTVMGSPSGRSEVETQTLVPLVAGAASHERSAVRSTAAWAMGACPDEPEFQAALGKLLDDPVPLVRRNAALALSKFNDRRSVPELLAMLQSFEVTAPVAGRIERMARKASPVRAQMHLAYITSSDGRTVPLESPLDGQVKAVHVADGDTVKKDQPLLTLNPGEADMWEALRALALVGGREEIPAVKKVAGRSYASQRVAQQAEFTCKMIEHRAATAGQ